MKIGDRETKFVRRSEAATRGVHADRGRGEWVFGREEECAPVLTTGIGSLWGAGEDVVPFENVGFGRMGDDIWRGVGLDGLVFAGQLCYVNITLRVLGS